MSSTQTPSPSPTNTLDASGSCCRPEKKKKKRRQRPTTRERKKKKKKRSKVCHWPGKIDCFFHIFTFLVFLTFSLLSLFLPLCYPAAMIGVRTKHEPSQVNVDSSQDTRCPVVAASCPPTLLFAVTVPYSIVSNRTATYTTCRPHPVTVTVTRELGCLLVGPNKTQCSKI
jgi:hypothetical protein